MASVLPASVRSLPMRRVALGGALLVVVALAYWFFFYSDVSAAIESQVRQEQNFKAELEQIKHSEYAYQKDLAELTDRQQRERELNKLLPATTEYPSFLSALQGVANVAGVTLQGWAPQEEVAEQFYARVPMKVTVVGTFHQIAKFFYGVGQLDRIINIENITLKEPKTEAGQILLKVECLATAFHTLAGAKGDKSSGGSAAGAGGGAAVPASAGGKR